jgi:hypothetical protein
MALNNEEIDKVNELYQQVDSLESQNKLLREEVVSRFDNIEQLINDLACKCGHETSSTE